MSLRYSLISPILHRMDPEKAHHFAIKGLASGWAGSAAAVEHPSLTQTLFGLEFNNPVGLAAGFDKNAEAVKGLAQQGFGFLEVGTVTPKPQPGNETPRIFRLKEDGAVINRLGFNNEGAQAMVERLEMLPKQPLTIGVNIGRNKDCADPISDYQQLVKNVYKVADYITINVSSPNTQGLRDLQQKRQLGELLTAVMNTRDEEDKAHQTKKPLLLKISPDVDAATKEDIAELALSFALDGMIISNTTIKRPNTLKNHKYHGETGGLSGKPLMKASTKLLSEMHILTKGKVPLVGVGGISSAQDAYAKILAGASLVQIYSAFIYQGFGLVGSVNRGLITLLERDGFKHIEDAIGKAN